jgi:hypothetical protein
MPTPTPWYYNVLDYGATGDGSTDDTQAIQEALDDVENKGGGILYFPVGPSTKGRYIISDTIKLPSKVYIKGVTGTTYNGIDNWSTPPPFIDKVNTIIKLEQGEVDTPIAMIRAKDPDNFFSAGIENIILWGNRTSDRDEGEEGYYGIKINDIHDIYPQRSQTIIRNVIIYRTRGVGFYGGIGQHELFLEWVTAFANSSDGFVLRGEDIKGTRLASGANGGVGIKFPGSGSNEISSGAGRFYDVDSWSNKTGIEISDTMGYVFFNLVLNLNKQGGVFIHPTNSETGFPPGNIRIFHGAFSFNSQDRDETYSDILIEGKPSGGPGAYDVAFIGCKFHGSTSKEKYAIEDNSLDPRRCLIFPRCKLCEWFFQ